jgi:hypothetical protein
VKQNEDETVPVSMVTCGALGDDGVADEIEIQEAASGRLAG